MVQMQTYLKVADNTGAKELMCFRVLGGTRKRYANIGDIGACFGNGIVIWNNVIVFPKVLNELSGEDIDELVEGILQTKFPAREYYICFSHNRSNVADYYYKNEDHGLRISGRIVEAIREAVENTGCFDGSCRKLYCNSDIIGRGPS